MLLSAMTKHEGGRFHDGEMFLPWYTGPCLEWLMTLDLVGKKVFEYGTGDSTKWYASQGADVYGVDSNAKWLPGVADPSAIGFCLATDNVEYRSSINNFYYEPDFYLVIIDGDFRDQCTGLALKALKPGGYLIIDNWEQSTVCPDWPLTKKFIEGMPIKLYFEPDHWDKWCTAVIQKPL